LAAWLFYWIFSLKHLAYPGFGWTNAIVGEKFAKAEAVKQLINARVEVVKRS
jgi:hypothetical protein